MKLQTFTLEKPDKRPTPSKPEILPKTPEEEPGIKKPGKPEIAPDLPPKPEMPQRPIPQKPDIRPGRTTEPEVPPTPPEPHE